MTTTVHKDLTGADLHEPKGADTALSGQVYVSNGAGGGVWTAASDIITNTAWSTGDLKATHKTTADATWVLWSDGTIGDGSSGATIRANADCSALFTLYWNGYSNTLCPVSSGRGISAAADFAAHKTIAVPVAAGRAFGLAGSGSGLTTRTLGSVTGAETYSITQANLPSVNFTVNIPSGQGAHTHGLSPAAMTFAGNQGTSGSTFQLGNNTGLSSTSSATLPAMSGTAASGGSGTAHSLVQPTAFVNVMIKL